MNERLRKARNDRHWSIDVAAGRIGVSRTTFLRWEHGEQIPHDSTILMACEAFKMSAEQLGFGNSTSKAHTKPAEAYSLQFPTTSTGPTVDMLSIGVLALALAQYQYRWTSRELRLMVEQEMKRLDEMKQYNNEGNISRREALSFLAGLPVALFGIAQVADLPSIIASEEALPFYIAGVPACWRMYFSGGLTEVKQVLPNYLAHLSTIAQQPSHYHQQFASLASQACQLGYLLALQSQDFNIAQTHAKQALEYATLAHDPNLQVASLIRQGNLFFTMKRPLQTLQKYQAAIQSSDGASPLLIGQAYTGLSEAYARLGQKQEALRFRGLAEDTFPGVPEDDPNFEYTHFNHFTRINFAGLMHLHLHQPQAAWDLFSQIDRDVPTSLVPQRVELLSRQALTSVSSGDMEQSCRYVELAAHAALHIGSELRYNEVNETYQMMLLKWPDEHRVRRLEELFQL